MTCHPLDGPTGSAPLVRAYRGERGERPPVWFMRQAGRSLPEYRALRVGTDMLQACLDPALVTEITLQPVRRHHVDAAILFSDIVVPLLLTGVQVEIVAGRGPVFARPISDAAAVADLVARPIEEAMFSPVSEAVGLLIGELGATPLIGFAGAPFTLAAYLVAGGPSRDQLEARRLMHADPAAWAALMDWTAQVSGAFLAAQVRAGASAVQLFDSWVGGLSAADYTAHVATASAHTLAAVQQVRADVPVSHFGVGTSHLLEHLAAPAGHPVDVVGVDHRVPLEHAAARLPGLALQGNIDPALLAAPWPVLAAHVRAVIDSGRHASAHVLNLGHGVPPDADPDVLTRITSLVHES